MKTKILLLLLVGLSMNVNAQYWMLGGNPNLGINGLLSQSNKLGSKLATDVIFITNNTNRMILKQGTGFLGIGNLSPAFRLDVNDNINVTPTVSFDGYKINKQRFLFMPGGLLTANTFVGISGNLANMTTAGYENTLVGFSAGGGMGTGVCNSGAHSSTLVGAYAGFKTSGGYITAIGFRAGYNIDDGDFSTFVGAYSGQNASCSFDNAFFGGFSGSSVTLGSFNTYLGMNAAGNATTGRGNIAVGASSASGLTGGGGNIAIGTSSGVSLVNNSNNILIGNSSDIGTSGVISNSIAFGNNTKVLVPDQIILGNNKAHVGIGLNNDVTGLGPQNKLEIDAGINGMSPTPAGNVGASGLRLRDLHALTLPVTNPGKGVLAVDANGDVIYVLAPSSSSGGLGNLCSNPGSNPLPSTWEIPMNNFNFMFNDVAGSTFPQEVGIGHFYGTCGNIYNSKFEVLTRGTHEFAGAFENTSNLLATPTVGIGGRALSITDDAFGVKGVCLGAAASGAARGVGVLGMSNGNTGAFNFGVAGEASNGTSISVGGNFEVTALSSSVSLVHVGAAGSIGNGAAMLATKPAGTTIGVYGYNSFAGNPTFPGGPNWAGYFDGDVNINGFSYTSLGIWSGSDLRFKKDLQPLGDVITKIKKMNGYTYTFKQDEFKSKNFDDGRHIGLIAQELKEVFPELVREDKQGFYAVNYDGMVPVLLEAIKQQQSAIEKLQKQFDELKNNMPGSTGSTFNGNSGSAGIANQNVELSDKNVVVLNQNVPNPFAEQTVITYYIPDQAGKAQLLFYNETGQLIKATDITERGSGQITVFANDLSTGVYSYALIVDDKLADTKKMIKQK
jgi:hypothetical protein